MTEEFVKRIRNSKEKAENYFAKKLAFSLGPVELKGLSEEGKVIIIDVRNKSDYNQGHLPQAMSIPYDEIENRLEELNTHIFAESMILANFANALEKPAINEEGEEENEQ